MGPKRSSFHCLGVLSRSGRPLTLGSPRPVTGAGAEVGVRDCAVSLAADAEKSLPSAQRGQDQEGPGPRPARRGGKARAPLSGGPGSFPALFPTPGDAHRTGCSQERHKDQGDGSRGACLPVLRFLDSHLLVAPEPSWLSVRPFPGLASPFLLRPSPSSLLSGPFLSSELAFSALSS